MTIAALKGKTFVVPLLVAANLLMFLGIKIAGVQQSSVHLLSTEVWQEFTHLNPQFALPILTSAFTHFEPLHMLGNMMPLLLCGMPIERQLGRGRFAIFYGAAMLFTGLLFAALNFNFPVAVVGASGAVAAIQGAMAVFLLRERLLSWLDFAVATLALCAIDYGLRAFGLSAAAAGLTVVVLGIAILMQESRLRLCLIAGSIGLFAVHNLVMVLGLVFTIKTAYSVHLSGLLFGAVVFFLLAKRRTA